MTPEFADPSGNSIPLHVIESSTLTEWSDNRSGIVRDWVNASGFGGAVGEVCLVSDENGRPRMALAGYGTPERRARGRFHLAGAASRLPAGSYHIESGLNSAALAEEALGWLLSRYAFARYRKQSGARADLVAPHGIDARRLEIIAAGECLTRDLINTPACDMGPAELEAAFTGLAETHGAAATVIRGDGLLDMNLPMIHAVGRASPRSPRLLELRWGGQGPTLTLIGKGVCFDTGGLNLKPVAAMALMKKDMGGAATVLGLAHMIMALKLPLRLRVLIPAVENSVAGNACRPQDILTSRKGLTVEINSTDAEGRLVLADALALAAEDPPDLLISMATLTGAARIALGADIAPYYTDDPKIAAALDGAAARVADPVWRMPFHAPYEAMIEPGIADLDNAPEGGFGGSITAALFLRRFAEGCPRYVHFDIYGWQSTAAPARPRGGVGQGARAVLEALPGILWP